MRSCNNDELSKGYMNMKPMMRTDFGPEPFVANIKDEAMRNQFFRTALWTGTYLQMTLMSIPGCGEIGMEMHPDIDQVIRVEEGQGVVKMGYNKNQMEFQLKIKQGDAVFVPAGTWHNIMNATRCPLKLSSIYAPIKHPRGTIHRTKQEAEESGY